LDCTTGTAAHLQGAMRENVVTARAQVIAGEYFIFYPAEVGLERHANGCGIGLFTVKKIIIAHGGRVGYETNDVDEKCNTFYFEVPKKDLLKKTQLL